jgi:hypothetical protein
MKTYMRKIIIIVFLFIGLSIMSFSNFVYSEEPVDSGLSLANVHSIYHTNDKILQIKIVLLNTSSDNITVLTDHLNTQFLKDSNKYVIGVGSMTAKYQGYNIIESLYKFAPVTLKPKEGTFVNHLVKKTFKDINKNTDFIVKYEIREKFGKRFNVWYGAVESGPIKPKIIK